MHGAQCGYATNEERRLGDADREKRSKNTRDTAEGKTRRLSTRRERERTRNRDIPATSVRLCVRYGDNITRQQSIEETKRRTRGRIQRQRRADNRHTDYTRGVHDSTTISGRRGTPRRVKRQRRGNNDKEGTNSTTTRHRRRRRTTNGRTRRSQDTIVGASVVLIHRQQYNPARGARAGTDQRQTWLDDENEDTQQMQIVREHA